MTPDVERLPLLAASLLEGDYIEWEAERASATQEVRSVLDHLAVIRKIADVHGTTPKRDAELSNDAPKDFPPRWGHLRLLERIGRGTYGEVFRAWDENLDREVALKLLSPPTDDATAHHSLQEGRRLAKIQHSNVVLVHGAERRDDRVGIWMEFVRGKTMAAIVRDAGPFSAEEAALIGARICRAVAAVHSAGLLHCDIKAGNIVRESGGRIVLLDFGAATSRMPHARHQVAGTPVYTAPEVLDGAVPSAQSDIYAIGVVLFYLVTGTYPVSGDDIECVRRSHLHDRRRLADLRPDLPDAFVRVVERALADPADRWATAGAMEAALSATIHTRPRTPGSSRWALLAAASLIVAVGITWLWAVRRNAPPTPVISSIAVLPFQDASLRPQDAYVRDGITYALIDRLSAAKGLRVVSSTSSLYFRDHPALLSDIGRMLSVDAVVEGSIQTTGRDVRLTARLIDPRSDRVLWRKTLERSDASVADAQDALAMAIATELQHELPASSRRRIDTSAYDAFLHGQYELAKRTPDALRNARQFFEESIEHDPEYASAHAALAEAFTLQGAFGTLPAKEAYPRARAAALEALRFDDRQSMAHAVLGYLLFAHDSAGAYREFQKAVELDPSNSTARQWWSLSLSGEGRYDEAIAVMARARADDPLSKIIASDAASLYRKAGRIDTAREELRRLLALYPEYAEGHRQLALLEETQKHYEAAKAEYETAIRQSPSTWYLVAGLACVDVHLGDRAEAERILETLRRKLPANPEIYGPYIEVAAALERVKEVRSALRKCRALGVMECHPGDDHPEVDEFMKAMGENPPSHRTDAAVEDFMGPRPPASR